jgi:hypothetical protein
MGQPVRFVLALGDDHANGTWSQRSRFYFPRYGMICEKGHEINRLD